MIILIWESNNNSTGNIELVDFFFLKKKKKFKAIHEMTNSDKNFVKLTSETLVLQDIVNLVKDDGAGAISTFNGTTRNTFEGKKLFLFYYYFVSLIIFYFILFLYR
jgi:hypothetical protein